MAKAPNTLDVPRLHRLVARRLSRSKTHNSVITMNVIKYSQSWNGLISLAIERQTLSDGSHVFGVRIGNHLLDCVNQKDAERAFLCFEKGIGIIEGDPGLADLEIPR